jgi:putative flippase GtrA
VTRLFRYGVVGVAQNGGLYLAGLVLIGAGLAGWQATAATYPIGVLLSFLGNRGWTFADRERTQGQLARYIAVYGAGYAFSIGVVWALERAVDSWLAVLLAIPICALAMYAALQAWVFRASRPAG